VTKTIMIENQPRVDFENYLRARKFQKAAEILVAFCHDVSVETITEILAAAYVSGYGLKFENLPNKLKPRRRRVENAFQRLKQLPESNHDKDQRRQKNIRLRPKTLRDGKHRRKH
jgi:hypothetical protein